MAVLFPRMATGRHLRMYRLSRSTEFIAARLANDTGDQRPAKPVRRIAGLAEQFVVIGMRADPEPHKAVVRFDGECTMMAANPHGPEPARLLEVKRRVSRVALETLVGLIGQIADASRQRPIARPKVGGRVMLQRGVVLRPAWSRSALSASASSFPALASAASCASQTAQSNS